MMMVMVFRRFRGCAGWRHRMVHRAVRRRNAAVRVRALEAQTDCPQNGDGQLHAHRERCNRTGAGTPRHDLADLKRRRAARGLTDGQICQNAPLFLPVYRNALTAFRPVYRNASTAFLLGRDSHGSFL